MNTLPGNISPTGEMWVRSKQVFCGEILTSDKVLRILDGRVTQIVDSQNVPYDATVWDADGCISPGFFDIQVNGGGGVLLNKSPSPNAIKSIALAHRKFGTTGILPTVITDRPEVMEMAADAIGHAFGSDGVKGLHIEGPHISLARRGTHAAKYVRPMDETTLGVVRGLREKGIPVFITVAPESTTPSQVGELVEMGAVVSIGHSDADADATNGLLNSGVTSFTHLFNAMSPMLNRSPGVTGTAINSQAYCSFICDGVHVDDEMLALAIRARPIADRMVLISDAMPTVGGPDEFELYGNVLKLRDGRLLNAEGSLAGAHTTMARSLARVVTALGVPLEEALRMAISNPARLIGVPNIAPLQGARFEDLILISEDLNCSLLSEEVLTISQ